MRQLSLDLTPPLNPLSDIANIWIGALLPHPKNEAEAAKIAASIRLHYPLIKRKDARQYGLTHYLTGKPCKHGHIELRYRGHCVKCRKDWQQANPEKMRESIWRWKKAHQEKVREGSRRRYKASPEKHRKKRRRQYWANPERARETARLWAKANPEKMRESRRRWTRAMYASDPAWRIECNTRSRINQEIKKAGAKKSARSLEMLACSGRDLRRLLEMAWQPHPKYGFMSWDNDEYWGLDHIYPVSKLRTDPNYPDWQHIAFHWLNCQPLWHEDNLKKRDRMDGVCRMLPEIIRNEIRCASYKAKS